MTRRRTDAQTDKEPIAELFGDVVKDGASRLYPASGGPVTPRPYLSPFGSHGPLRPLPMPADAPPPLAASPRHRAASGVWRDDHGLLSGVVIAHGLITALTFGLWRFWMVSEQRGVLWSHTALEREPLEWTGRGTTMFLGAVAMLLALAAMVAVTHSLDLATALDSLVGVAPPASPAAALLAQGAVTACVALPPVWIYAVFLARRYQLSRTRWKGIRFGLVGSGLGLVARWLLWAPVLVATAGLAWPFWRWAREGHLTRCSRWGGAAFRFEGGPWRLALHWLPVWALGAAAAALATRPDWRAALGPLAPEAIAARGPLATLAAIFAAALVVWLAWINWRAAEFREIWRARRLLQVRVSCDLSIWHLIDASMQVSKRNLWPGIGVYVAIAVVSFVPAASAFRAERFDPTAAGLLGAVSGTLEQLELIIFDGFRTWRAQSLLLMSMMVNYVMSLVFVFWLWSAIYRGRAHRHQVESLRFAGLDSLDDVVQSAEARAADGLAGPLDPALG